MQIKIKWFRGKRACIAYLSNVLELSLQIGLFNPHCTTLSAMASLPLIWLSSSPTLTRCRCILFSVQTKLRLNILYRLELIHQIMREKHISIDKLYFLMSSWHNNWSSWWTTRTWRWSLIYVQFTVVRIKNIWIPEAHWFIWCVLFRVKFCLLMMILFVFIITVAINRWAMF